MTEKTLITYCIGFPFSTGFTMKKRIIRSANLLTGGCTITYSDGYWIDGAHVEQQMYHDKAIEEMCMKIELVVPTGKLEYVLKHMRWNIIRAVRADHAEQHENQPPASVGWVQVTVAPVQAYYFHTDEDL